MSRSFGPSEGLKYPSPHDRSGSVGHDYPSGQHPHYYPPPPYLPTSHEYHGTGSPHGTLTVAKHPPPYGTAYPGYETTGFGGPPTSFDSNGSQHPPSVGPMPPHVGYSMASYPPYFQPWTVVPPPSLVIDIKPSDILCGRGGATNAHSGNRAFRSLVKDHQQKYLNAKKRDKPSVASKIVSLIREKGGRFLRRYDTDHTGQVRWVDIGDDRAREKTCQALRENAPELRKRKLVASSSEEEEKPSKRMTTTHFHSPVQAPGASYSMSSQHSLSTPEISYVHRTRTNDEITSPPKEGEDGPIMVRPYARLLPGQAPVDPIPLDELSPQDRALYLQDFLPPCPPLRPKTTSTPAPQSPSASLPWPILSV